MKLLLQTLFLEDKLGEENPFHVSLDSSPLCIFLVNTLVCPSIAQTHAYLEFGAH